MDCRLEPEAKGASPAKTMLFQYCLLEWTMAAESAAILSSAQPFGSLATTLISKSNPYSHVTPTAVTVGCGAAPQ